MQRNNYLNKIIKKLINKEKYNKMNKYFRNKNIKNKFIKKIKIRLILILKNNQNLKMILKMTINQLK